MKPLSTAVWQVQGQTDTFTVCVEMVGKKLKATRGPSLPLWPSSDNARSASANLRGIHYPHQWRMGTHCRTYHS